jgi:hypothetical protein
VGSVKDISAKPHKVQKKVSRRVDAATGVGSNGQAEEAMTELWALEQA